MIGRRGFTRTLAAALLAVSVACVHAPLPAQSATAAPTVILVIRHAEKQGDPAAMTADPALTPEGVERAGALVPATRHLALAAVYSTQYVRTRETARPAAEAAGVTVTVRPVDGRTAATYAPDLAAHLLAQHAGRTVLVVGHSNTVPAIVKALSGRDVGTIPDERYGDLFTVIIPAGATPSAAQPATVVVSRIGR